MSLDLFIITAFCRIDDTLKAMFNGQRFRQRGPVPALWDAEVLTLEVVGEYLGFTQDLALYRYFRRHYTHFFPALARVHRTTFTRQWANLWKVKGLVWQRLLDPVEYDPTFALVDSFPLPELIGVAGSQGRRLLARIPWSGRPSTALESISAGAGLG